MALVVVTIRLVYLHISGRGDVATRILGPMLRLGYGISWSPVFEIVAPTISEPYIGGDKIRLQRAGIDTVNISLVTP